MVRMSMSWSIAAGRSALASSRRCCPILMATARAPTLVRICRASESGTMPERRGIQHQRGGVGRREAVVQPVDPEIRDRGHVDHQAGDHHERDGQQQQLAGQAEPPRRLRPRRLMVGWSSVADTNIRLDTLLWRAPDTRPASLPLIVAVSRMRSAPGPVKLPIANVRRFRSAGASRLLARKNPAKTDIFAPIAPFQRTPIAAPRNIDENRSLPYKPRQLSAMARSRPGAAHLGP